MTIHRQENVDNERNLREIIKRINLVSKSFDFTILFPVHPGTRSKLAELNIKPSDKIVLLEPLEFLEFLQLEKYSRLILTDSGGVQEEACVLKVPCVTLRNNTERPETLEVGANILAGMNTQKIVDCVRLIRLTTTTTKSLGLKSAPATIKVFILDGKNIHRLLNKATKQ